MINLQTEDGMAKRAIPKTHLILSLINHELPERHVTALCEFIDNSLGEGAGNATEVLIRYDAKRIIIRDNGEGVQRPQALFTLGDSESRLHHRDIGQFGFGAKVGALYLAWHMAVETVHDGRLHAHEVDWERVLKSGLWPLEYDGSGVPAPTKRKGTDITLTRRHKGRVWQGEPLAQFLAHIYRPALLAGKKITVQQRTGSKFTQWELSKYLGKLVLEDKQKLSGVVEGKHFHMLAGISRDLTARLNGVHIAFGHRFIKTEGRLIERHVPAGLYAEVMLSEEWKSSLSSNKSSLVQGHDELLAEVERLLKPLLDKLEERAREIEIKSISVELQSRAQEAIDGLSDELGESGEGEDIALVGDGDGGGGDVDGRKPRLKAEGKGAHEPKAAANRRTGINVVWPPNMGERVSKVDVSKLEVRVSLNRDLLIIKGSRDNIHSLLVTVFNAVLDECLIDEGVRKRLFPDFARSVANGEAPFNAKQRQLYKLLCEHEQTRH